VSDSDISMRSVDSIASMDSASTTSTASTQAEQFSHAVEELMVGDLATDDYAERAEGMIASLASRTNPNEFAPNWYKECKARFPDILSAMMKFAVECGGGWENRGERSLRYVSCAIAACTRGNKDSEDTHRALAALAITWFCDLLWICELSVSVRRK
jgi:hypothetical protein